MFNSQHESLSLASNSSSFFLILFLHILFASLFASIYSFFIEILEHMPVAFGFFVNISWENSSQSFQLFLSEFSSMRHIDLEIND